MRSCFDSRRTVGCEQPTRSIAGSGLLPYGDRITIGQLLTHTSGLIDNNDMVGRVAPFIARVKDPVAKAELTRVAIRARTDRAIEYSPRLWIELARWQPLRSTPGTTYHYSNIGFEVLGLIAVRASGRDLRRCTATPSRRRSHWRAPPMTRRAPSADLTHEDTL